MRRQLGLVLLSSAIALSAMSEELRILTDPEGAEVWQGPLRLGVTGRDGLRLVGIEPGRYTYRIKKDGFEDVDKPVLVESGGGPMTVVVRLVASKARGTTSQPPPTTAPQPPPKSVEPPPTAAEAKREAVSNPRPQVAPATKKGGSKTALVVLGGAALVGGGIAVAAGGGGSNGSSPTTTTTLPPVARLEDLSANVTSPQQSRNLNCTELAYFTVSLTNRAPALVQINGVLRRQGTITGGCSATNDFTYRVTNPSIGTGTANVLTNQPVHSGGTGCCFRGSPCSGATCHIQYSFTVLTSVGEVPAGSIDYGVVFRGCPTCSSSAAPDGVTCLLQ